MLIKRDIETQLEGGLRGSKSGMGAKEVTGAYESRPKCAS